MIQDVTLKREYDKGGKFKDYVDGFCKKYNSTPEVEMKKVVVQEYFKTVQRNGINEDKSGKGIKVSGTGANQC